MYFQMIYANYANYVNAKLINAKLINATRTTS